MKTQDAFARLAALRASHAKLKAEPFTGKASLT
jgi:hypothetical protein